jgi:hypothetical protein
MITLQKISYESQFLINLMLKDEIKKNKLKKDKKLPGLIYQICNSGHEIRITQ